MLYSIIRPNNYQDSLRLMRLSNAVAGADGVDRVSVMMGTKMNKEILRNAGLASPDLDNAKPTDLLIAADVANEEVGDVSGREGRTNSSPSRPRYSADQVAFGTLTRTGV